MKATGLLSSKVPQFLIQWNPKQKSIWGNTKGIEPKFIVGSSDGDGLY